MNDERARQGVEHLQAAAIEVIAALRAFLDVAEDVVRDPASAAALASSLVEQARTPGATSPAPDPGNENDPGPDAGERRVTRIRVS